MKKLILNLILMLILKAGFAQFTITGRVLHGETGEHIAGANVNLSWDGGTASKVSDDLGNFRFEDLKGGDYTISINVIGFIPYQESINLNGDLTKQFLLLTSTTDIDMVTISVDHIPFDVPTTMTTISKREITLKDQGKDFPFLLNSTPSTVINSDAGNGIGYTGVRIRGIDPTRVNVMINGIPLNDAESQGVFWVDLPDLASSTQEIQIQRGVGTSTNGAAAFGASINIRTDIISNEKYAYANLGYGSFNTFRSTLGYGTGRFKNGFAFQTRMSYIQSDGFIDRASSNLMSAQFTGDYKTKKSSLKFNIMLGLEETYQAWYGIPQPKFRDNQQELEAFANGLYIFGDDRENLFESNPSTYNYYTYDNEVDHYAQNHYQLFYNQVTGENSNIRIALHATTGKGYYEQQRLGDSLMAYGLSNQIQNGDTLTRGDLQRRLWLDNIFYGTVINYRIDKGRSDLNIGMSINQYRGKHFGEVISTEFTEYEALNQVYYENDAIKNDANVYLKYQYELKRLKPYIDLQVRQVQYTFEGPNRNGEPSDQTPEIPLFFNPKFGASYMITSRLKLYGLYAIGNREPVRDDYVNSSPDSRPTPENVKDLEVGLDWSGRRSFMTVNYYNMQYKDALVIDGSINDVGGYTRINIPESYRKGWEFAASFNLTRKISIAGNYTSSQNRILNYTEYVPVEWGASEQEIQYEDETNIALSPERIAYAQIRYHFTDGLYLDVTMKHVGEQYLDNTSSDERKLDAFTTYNAALAYNKDFSGKLKSFNMAFYLNNFTDVQYAPTGYTFSNISGGERMNYNYVYPMAGINFMVRARIEF
ncbi:TonB-dependent receptor [bacterium]|nr:TonB-dependent receptor [bacterium]